MPGALARLAEPHVRPIERRKLQPKTLQTTRLRPTNELPAEYRSGAVEGAENRWRDVSLRKVKPGPLVRTNPNFMEDAAKSG